MPIQERQNPNLLYVTFQGVFKYDKVQVSFPVRLDAKTWDDVAPFVIGLQYVTTAAIPYVGFKKKGANVIDGFTLRQGVTRLDSMSMLSWRIRHTGITTPWEGKWTRHDWKTREIVEHDRTVTRDQFIPFADPKLLWPGANQRYNQVLPTSRVWTDFFRVWHDLIVVPHHYYTNTGTIGKDYDYVSRDIFPASSVETMEWRISYPSRYTKAVIKEAEDERSQD